MNDLYIDLVEKYMDIGYSYEEAGLKAMEELPSIYADMVDWEHDRWKDKGLGGKQP